MVTHDQEEALSMADRVVVMNHGVIEQIGTPLDVYERPETPFVADFLGKVNVLKATCVGGGRYRVGNVEVATGVNGSVAGAAVRLYLRPEDRILADAGPVASMPNALSGTRAPRRFPRHRTALRASTSTASTASGCSSTSRSTRRTSSA